MFKKILMRLFRRKEKTAEKVIDYVHQTEIPVLMEQLIITAVLCGERKFLGRYTQEDQNSLYATEDKIRQILCKLCRGSLEVEKLDELLRYKIRECFFYHGYHHGTSMDVKIKFIDCPKGDDAVKRFYERVNEFISRLSKLEPNWKELLEFDDNIYCLRNGMVVLAEQTPEGDLIPKERNKSKGPARKTQKKIAKSKSG